MEIEEKEEEGEEGGEGEEQEELEELEEQEGEQEGGRSSSAVGRVERGAMHSLGILESLSM